jgi:hypothetical protein
MHKSVRAVAGLAIVGALLSTACTSIPGLFATPTPTATLTPTATPTPLPTPTPTPTPTPKPTGVRQEALSGNRTKIRDYDHNYEFVMSGVWIVVPLTAEDIAGKLNLLDQDAAGVGDIVESFSLLDPEAVRVVAFHEDAKYISRGFAANLSVTVVRDDVSEKLPLHLLMAAVREALHQRGVKVLGELEGTSENAHGVEIGALEFLQSVPDQQGGLQQAYGKTLIFNSGDGIVEIELATLPQFSEELLEEFDPIIDTIEIFQP